MNLVSQFETIYWSVRNSIPLGNHTSQKSFAEIIKSCEAVGHLGPNNLMLLPREVCVDYQIQYVFILSILRRKIKLCLFVPWWFFLSGFGSDKLGPNVWIFCLTFNYFAFTSLLSTLVNALSNIISPWWDLLLACSLLPLHWSHFPLQHFPLQFSHSCNPCWASCQACKKHPVTSWDQGL